MSIPPWFVALILIIVSFAGAYVIGSFKAFEGFSEGFDDSVAPAAASPPPSPPLESAAPPLKEDAPDVEYANLLKNSGVSDPAELTEGISNITNIIQKSLKDMTIASAGGNQQALSTAAPAIPSTTRIYPHQYPPEQLQSITAINIPNSSTEVPSVRQMVRDEPAKATLGEPFADYTSKNEYEISYKAQ
jgi:hypothetical protein